MSFLKDIFFYSGATISMQIISFLRGILIRIILIPEILGIYNLIQVILGFVLVFDTGASAAASRDLPILRGKNDIVNESLMRASVFWFTIVQSIIVGLGTILYALFYISEYSSLEIIGFFIVAILLVISAVTNSFDIFYRSAQDYLSLSKIVFLMGFVEAVTYVFGAYLGGIYGLLAGVVIAALLKLIVSVFIGNKKGITIKIEFSFPMLKKLLAFGFPLRLVDYPMQYMVMADLLWVTKFMDLGSLAIYTTAQLFFKQSNQVCSTFGSVFETRIIQHFGKYNSWEQIAQILRKYLYLQLLVVVPVLIWACATFIPFIIRQFLPEYVSACGPIVYLMLGNFFIVTNSGLTIPWFIKGKLISRGLANCIGLISTFLMLGFFWFVLKNHNLSSIVISVISGYMAYFIYLLIFVGRELYSIAEIVRTLIIVLLAALWIGIIIVLGFSYTVEGQIFSRDLFRTAIIGTITFVGIFPVVIVGYKLSDYKEFINMLD